jgi:predicted metal-dependent enzyme (double-stranded beta helix superfamily)
MDSEFSAVAVDGGVPRLQSQSPRGSFVAEEVTHTAAPKHRSVAASNSSIASAGKTASAGKQAEFDADLVSRLRSLQWNDLRVLSTRLPDLLAELADHPTWLAAALGHLIESPRLQALSERLAELDKLVLLDDPVSGARVRLHVFRQGYFDRPHNHRFNFATRILSGEYVHTIYGHAGEALEPDPMLLVPRLIRREQAGEGYVIEHTLVHSVAAAAETVTLTIRGPAAKDRMLIVDAKDGPFWAFGAKDEDEDEIQRRRLPVQRLVEIRDMLVHKAVVGHADADEA